MVLDKGLEDKALKTHATGSHGNYAGISGFPYRLSISEGTHLLSEIRTMRCSSVAGAADSD